MNECLTTPQHKNKIGYWMSKTTDRQIGQEIGKLDKRPVDRSIHEQIEQQTGRKDYRQIGQQRGRYVRKANRLIYRSIDSR